MCRPVCFAKLLSQWQFSWRWLRVAGMTAISSAKIRSSKCENMFHWIPRGLSEVVSRITQSMTTRNRILERIQPWSAPDLTLSKHSARPCQSILQNDTLFEMFINFHMMITTCILHVSGNPYALRIFQRLSGWALSNSLSRTKKLVSKGTFHSLHCSMMFRRAQNWYMQPRPLRDPACSYLHKCTQTKVWIYGTINTLPLLLW